MIAATTRSGTTTQDDRVGVGSMIGQYRVVEEIGRGGMGVVLRAVHEGIGQVAAVKVLLSRGEGDATYLRRFVNEARAASRVDHPGLVKIFDFGHTSGGAPYLLMEHLAGELLRARLRRLSGEGQTMAPAAAARVARQAASALAALHAANIVHRDLKPENMMLVADDEAPGGERVKLLDFGIARVAGAAQETAPGVAIGTAAYMSPEQCVGDGEIDGHADVYSLGVVLYEMLAGAPPFRGGFAALLRCHLHEEPPPLDLAAPAAPAALVRLAHHMLAKEPSLRPSMAEVVRALRADEAPADDEGSGVEAGPDARTETRSAPARRSAPPAASPSGEPTERAAAPRSEEPPPSMPPSAGRRRAGLIALLAVTAAVAGAAALRPSGPAKPAVALTDMVHLPGGAFRMGSTPAEIDAECARLGAGCRRDLIEREQPAHEVSVSPFHLDVHEVTNEELADWLDVVKPTLEVSEDPEHQIDRWVREREEGLLLVDLYPQHSGVIYRSEGFTARPGYERRPAVQVTWDAARLYCKAKGKRLPTEAEWELAARGAASRRFPWGDEPPRCDGVVFGRDPESSCADRPPGPEPVKTAKQDRTPEGIFDMGGNVAEWVQDQFLLPYYAPCGACADPKSEGPAPLADDLRIFRGGAWQASEISSRTSTRSRWKRTDVQTGLGFRCASQ